MGVFRRGERLWVRFKAPDGRWRNERTEFVVGQEEKAGRAFRALVERLAAGVELVGARSAATTLDEYASMKWFPSRRSVISDWKSDEARLRLHVLPKLGGIALDHVRPRHLAELFRAMRAARALAPKSIHNVYGVLSALFRDAEIDGLIDASPCILTERQLGENVDADPEWRATAVFTRSELEMLVSDERVPLDRRVMYALQGVAGLRHGEAAGLRWRHLDTGLEPLGRMVIATSYDKGRTKTNRPRHVPVHPFLAAILAEWRLSGWHQMMGVAPQADDIVVPTPEPTNRGPRVPKGSMRSDHYSYKRLRADLAALGLRHRRGHDLRRTFISVARTDGARKDILELCTHTPSTSDAIDVYTTFPWEALCAEVAKLKIERLARKALISLPRVANISGTRYHAVTASVQVPAFTYENNMEAAGIEAASQSGEHGGKQPVAVESVTRHSLLGASGSGPRPVTLLWRRERSNDVTAYREALAAVLDLLPPEQRDNPVVVAARAVLEGVKR